MNKRIRASTLRTRSGCATCRQRKIRCDFAVPACQRCLRSGWTCPGYPSTDSSGASSRGSIGPTKSSRTGTLPEIPAITIYNLPFKIAGSQEERKSLHYFANFAAVDLTGYQSTDFWSRTILQRCQHETPVRHATAALGRCYIEYISASDPAQFFATPETNLAYRKSLKTLRTYIGKPDKGNHAVVLMCSALFYCFELVQGDRSAALRHLQSGLDILNDQMRKKHEQNPLPADELDDLLDVFARMDLQASGFDDARPLTLDYEPDQWPNETTQSLPFVTLRDSQRHLCALLHSTLSQMVNNVKYKFAKPCSIPMNVLASRQRLLEKFHLWECGIEMLERRKEAESNDKSAFLEAKLHALVYKLLLLHSIQDSQRISAPSFDDCADRILSLARDALSAEILSNNSGFSSKPGTPRFSMQLGIVAPVSLLAFKTLRPQVREAAVVLLQAALGRREGFYDAHTMVNVIGGLTALKDDRVVDSSSVTQPYRSTALEWSLKDFARVEDMGSETERWKGLDRLLALRG